MSRHTRKRTSKKKKTTRERYQISKITGTRKYGPEDIPTLVLLPCRRRLEIDTSSSALSTASHVAKAAPASVSNALSPKSQKKLNNEIKNAEDGLTITSEELQTKQANLDEQIAELKNNADLRLKFDDLKGKMQIFLSKDIDDVRRALKTVKSESELEALFEPLKTKLMPLFNEQEKLIYDVQKEWIGEQQENLHNGSDVKLSKVESADEESDKCLSKVMELRDERDAIKMMFEASMHEYLDGNASHRGRPVSFDDLKKDEKDFKEIQQKVKEAETKAQRCLANLLQNIQAQGQNNDNDDVTAEDALKQAEVDFGGKTDDQMKPVAEKLVQQLIASDQQEANESLTIAGKRWKADADGQKFVSVLNTIFDELGTNESEQLADTLADAYMG